MQGVGEIQSLAIPARAWLTAAARSTVSFSTASMSSNMAAISSGGMP